MPSTPQPIPHTKHRGNMLSALRARLVFLPSQEAQMPHLGHACCQKCSKSSNRVAPYDSNGGAVHSYRHCSSPVAQAVVAAIQGRLLFATTNRYHALDPALARPGRLDLHIEFTLASKWQAASCSNVSIRLKRRCLRAERRVILDLKMWWTQNLVVKRHEKERKRGICHL